MKGPSVILYGEGDSINKRYSWARYWFPANIPMSLSTHGFLTEWEAQKNGFTLQDLTTKHCLLLLGEPGMGKSVVLEEAFMALETNPTLIKLRVDLKDIVSEENLSRKLFNSEEFVLWLKHNHHLVLFLDSFDESFVPNLAKILLEKLEQVKNHIHRLSLRITCRSGQNPQFLEERLTELWGPDTFGVYFLAPLRQEDLNEALSFEGIPIEPFFEEIDRLHAGPLAARPITLYFLIEEYLLGQRLPNSTVQVYRKGCQRLCEKPDLNRNDGVVPLEDLERKLELATLIAVLTIVCNRSTVVTPNLGPSGKNVCLFSDIKGTADGLFSLSKVTSAEIIITLRTALFKSQGQDQFHWAHRNYGEFLASDYLVRHLTTTQILSLLVHPNSSKGHIVPQLHGTAAWVASMNKEVFSYLLEKDPEVLFLSDLSTVSDTNKAALVQVFLDLANIPGYELRYASYVYYHQLNHDGLPDQLREFIFNTKNDERACRIAIEIAIQCNLVVLREDMLRLAGTTYGYLQEKALRAFSQFANGDLSELLRFIKDNVLTPDIRVTTIAKYLWPKYISTLEVLELIDKSCGGSRYYGELVDKFCKDDTLEALMWVAKQKEVIFGSDSLANMIVEHSCGFLEVPEICEELSRLILARLANGPDTQILGTIGRKLQNNTDKQLLVANLIRTARDVDLALLTTPKIPIIRKDELDWFTENFKNLDSQTNNNLSRLKEIVSSLYQKKMELDQMADQRVSVAIDGFEDDEIMNWEKIYELYGYLGSDIEKFIYSFNGDNITELSGWKKIDETSRKRIIQAAMGYLTSLENIPTNIGAIEEALHLLFKVQPEFLLGASPHLWIQWIKANSMSFKPKSDEILRIAYGKISDLIINCLIEEVGRSKHSRGLALTNKLIHRMNLFWDDRMATMLLGKIQEKDIIPEIMGIFLGLLLKHNDQPSWHFAVQSIEYHNSVISSERTNAIEAARAMIDDSENAGWMIIWPKINIDPAFGKDVFFALTKDFYTDNLFKEDCLDTKQMSNLYCWLETQFEIRTDYKINEIKNEIVKTLQNRHTTESCYELLRLHKLFPRVQEISRLISSIESELLEKTWIPIPPDEVHQMAENKSLRPVQSGSQLLDVVVECLTKFEKMLRGETPLTFLMWDFGGTKPRDESALSDVLKVFLEENLEKIGIILNREVEVMGKRRIDIKIDVLGMPGTHRLRLPIELKGCWNRKLESAMEEQLVGQYMSPIEIGLGLYVIGWYKCDRWVDDDYRKKDVPHDTIEEARKYYEDQARELAQTKGISIRAVLLDLTY